MNDERAVEEIITKFLLNTCRLRPELSQPAVQAAELCGLFAAIRIIIHADIVPLTTGSVAEFYIEPIIPHVGDFDVMYHLGTQLAIPAGHPPPTQLPAEFHNYVQVCEIVDSHLPGYVYLPLRYLLTECPEKGQYNAAEYDRYTHYFTNLGHYASHRHGPAIQGLLPPLPCSLSTMDIVYSIRCLEWPSQAADWPTRHRYYDWPDSATVDRVVSSGCDVVGAVHRQCRQDEWMSKCQWRLSFSRAEIVLINSWIPVQQIVYHMLRVFVKSDDRLITAAKH